jgi:hypothetical protein
MILISKPGKPPHSPSSYRSISLLPIASKVFEKLLLNRLLPLVEHGKLLPTDQFGFRPKHSTIEQTHRLICGINNAIYNRQYCSASFLDISQAFEITSAEDKKTWTCTSTPAYAFMLQCFICFA